MTFPAALRLRPLLIGIVVSGAVSLAIPSTPLVAATTTYTSAWGGGTINAGDTAVLNNGATVTGNVIDDGTLQFNQTGTLTITSTISGTGTLSLKNTGTLQLSGTTAMPGIFGGTVVLDMTVNATQGRLKTANTNGSLGLVLGNSGTGTMNVNGGVAQIGNTSYLGYAAGGRGVVNLSSGTLSAYNLVVGGSGAGTFNLSGGSFAGTGGRLTVAESNSGTFTMTGGTASGFAVTIGTNAGSVGTATISGGGYWNTGSGLTVGGSGAGTLTVDGGRVSSTYGVIGRYAGGSGTATVTSGTWAENFDLTVGASGTGTLNLTDGLLNVIGSLSIGRYGTVVVGNGGTSSILLVGNGSVANAGSLQFNRSDASTYSFAVSGSGSVTKQGAGTLTLTGLSSYTGGSTITGGTLQIGDGGTTGAIAGNVVNNSAIIFNRSDASTYSGAISGSGTLMKQGGGKLTLAGSNSYSGLTTVSGGTLALSGSGTIGTGGLDLGTNGIFDLAALVSATYSLPATGNLAGSGTLSGDGKTLAVLGSFLPGNSPGTVTLGSGFTLDLSNTGTSVFQITSPLYTAGSFDLVNGTGSVTFGGILSLDFSGGDYAAGANVLRIFANTGGRSGSFSVVNFTGLGAGQSATFNAATGFITVVPEPSAVAMALAGLACGGYSMWRRRRA